MFYLKRVSKGIKLNYKYLHDFNLNPRQYIFMLKWHINHHEIQTNLKVLPTWKNKTRSENVHEKLPITQCTTTCCWNVKSKL